MSRWQKRVKANNIPEGWTKCRLGDIADIKMGQSPKSESYNDSGEGLPFLQGSRTFGSRYPLIDTYCTDPKIIANEGEILFSVRAPVGNINIADKKICIGRGLASLNAKNQQNLFLFYLLHFIKDDIINLESGTVFGSVNKKDLESVPILLPPLPEQRAIASIFPPIEDKIELLRQENETLYNMINTLFKQWFIKEAKEDWERPKLGEVVTITYGKNLPTKNLLESGYPVFGSNGQIGFYNEYMYDEPQVLISCRGAASGKVNISLPKSFVTNNSFILVRDKRKDIPLEYLKYYCLNYDFTPYITGSAQPQITIDNLYNAEFLIPPLNLINKFIEIVKVVEDKQINISEQIQTLTQLFDTLLHGLMSGKLRVDDVLCQS